MWHKFLCFIGFHKWEYHQTWPKELQPHAYWKWWTEKCAWCNREKAANDLVK